jgi:hypothetical protein
MLVEAEDTLSDQFRGGKAFRIRGTALEPFFRLAECETLVHRREYR